ncbi:MAG: lysylphosphatidylglycerol synthase transmembrane domain-containing protein [Candidatus Hodarchaeota archaeon]
MRLTKTRILFFLIVNLLIIVGMLIFIGGSNLSLAVKATRKNWIFPLIFLLMLTVVFILRGLRWMIIIPKFTRILVLIRALLAAWFINAVFPGKLGEVARVVISNREEKIDTGTSIASLVTDRLLDLLTLVILFAIFLFMIQREIVFAKLGLFYLIVTSILILGIICSMTLVLYKPDFLKKLVSRIFSPIKRLTSLSQRLIDSLHRGMKDIITLKITSFLCAIILSIVIWLFESSSIYIFAHALEYDISLSVTIIAAIFGFLAMTLPVTPGGFGTYEATVAGLLIFLTDLSLDNALLLALIDHIFRQLYVVVIGGISLQTFEESFSIFNL